MAGRINPTNIRKSKARDLRMLGEILGRSRDICMTPEALTSAANRCEGAKNDIWGYNLNGLYFTIPTPRNSIPSGLDSYLTLELSVDICGVCNSDESDKLRSLAVDIEISTINNREKCMCSWHLDRHIYEECDGDSDEVHPLYHFQHGGKRIEELSGEIGRSLILDPPRIGHPPLDGVLAIDFILANFAGSLWRRLRADGAYVNIVKGAQEHLWQPYYEAMSKTWGATQERKVARPEMLMPTLTVG